MPKTTAAGRIGPNALTQLLPLLDAAGGTALRNRLLRAAGIATLPEMTGLIDEAPVARLHQLLRSEFPDDAPHIARQAGLGTADYILAHRIPRPVQAIFRGLPPAFAGPLLARAIARNAWTFAGSGRFVVLSTRPMRFAIHDNPVVRGERAERPVCHWHSAVFERLFRRLVDDRLRARETACCAAGGAACIFEIAAAPRGTRYST